MSLESVLVPLGGLASRRQLSILGVGRRAVDRALREKRLLPIRPGWVADGTAWRPAVEAVLRGGRLTGSTALGVYGVWRGLDTRMHIQLPRDSHRRRSPPPRELGSFPALEHCSDFIVLHWAPHSPRRESAPDWIVSIDDALVTFAKRASDEQIVAAIESAVHTGRMPRTLVPRVFDRLPRRIHRLSDRLGLLSESGLESVVRFRLANCGYRIEQQVRIGGDRVDLVIDGWLVIELDGGRWHDPIEDRRRTNRLIRAGYRLLRFGYFDVFEQWHLVLETIRAMHSDSSLLVTR